MPNDTQEPVVDMRYEKIIAFIEKRIASDEKEMCKEHLDDKARAIQMKNELAASGGIMYDMLKDQLSSEVMVAMDKCIVMGFDPFDLILEKITKLGGNVYEK